MPASSFEIRRLAPADVRQTAAMLARSFADSPITEHLLRNERRRGKALVAYFTGVLRDAIPFGESWGAVHEGLVLAASLWLPPGAYPQDARREVKMLAPLLPHLPFEPRALPRMLRFYDPVAKAHPKDEHWYLAVLGTDPSQQGRGIGGALLQATLDRIDEQGLPTYLETDKARNVPFYNRFRFVETERLEPVPDAPPLWLMWRDPA